MFKSKAMLPPIGFFHRLKSELGSARLGGKACVHASRRRWAQALSMEVLEERSVPSGYSVINMGSLGGTFQIVLDINSRGAAVGDATTANNETEHAFLFSHGRMSDLGTLGGSVSAAFGINDSGEVVGLSTTSPGSMQPALFLYRHGYMTDLGMLDTSKPFGDIKINNHGDVIGFALSDDDASLLRHGRMIDLGALAGLGSAARALNDRDEVVGYSAIDETGSNLIAHAFLYNHGKMIDLGTLGGPSSVANDINADGEVVGASTTASGATHPFLYRHGHLTDLGTLGGAGADAAAINDRGEVVGDSLTSAGVHHGFLYNHGKMIDLNSLIPASSGFVITNAQDINDGGQIAAQAISTNPQNHTEYDVLLNPKTNGLSG
jgi:probable HAF family extracellular repeat protein